jgi:hypothetical protein
MIKLLISGIFVLLVGVGFLGFGTYIFWPHGPIFSQDSWVEKTAAVAVGLFCMLAGILYFWFGIRSVQDFLSGESTITGRLEDISYSETSVEITVSEKMLTSTSEKILEGVSIGDVVTVSYGLLTKVITRIDSSDDD